MQPELQMDSTIIYDKELNCIVVRTSGFGSLENIFQSHKKLMKHPMWHPGRNVMVDHRDLQLSHLKPEDINSLVSMVKDSRSILGDGNFAVVLDGDFIFGLGRMWEISSEPNTDLQIRIFRDPEEALLWVSQSRA